MKGMERNMGKGMLVCIYTCCWDAVSTMLWTHHVGFETRQRGYMTVVDKSRMQVQN